MNMSITFSDGMTFDTVGALHLTRRRDGWYVCGNGILIPVRDVKEGREIIKDMKDTMIKEKDSE